MSLRPLASLGVKLLGLYAILGALPSVGLFFYPFVPGLVGPGSPAPWKIALVNALPGACQMIVGVGLWAFSDGIAHSLVKEESETPLLSPTIWGALLFSAVGAFSLVEFAVQLARFLASVWMVNQSNFDFAPAQAHIGLSDFLPIAVRGALGLWLLLGARGIVRGVLSLKNVGRDAQEL